MIWLKKIFFWSLGVAVSSFLLAALCNWWIQSSTKKQIYSSVNDVPARKVGLVLGTARLINGTYRNPYFDTRIETAATLFKAGKVKHLLVSGDNSIESYNEPEDMQKALIKAGVPASAITLDYAGFRTLDSVVRCAKIFGQDQFVLISQAFHTPRALFIANFYGLDAIAINTKSVLKSHWTKPKIREYLAKCKAVLDLYILRKQPKFLGKKEKILIS